MTLVATDGHRLALVNVARDPRARVGRGQGHPPAEDAVEELAARRR